MKNQILGSFALLLVSSLPAQWVDVTPASQAPGRVGHGMAFNPTTGTALAVCGDTLSGPFGSLTDETWSYDGSVWTQLAPTTNPHATAGVRLVYDINRGVYVMYGGAPAGFFGGPTVDRTWEFDGVDWTEVFPMSSPGGRAYYAMAYDPIRSVTVLYGGMFSTQLVGDSNQTWEWNGTDWTQTALAGAPGPLERASMCYHISSGNIVMFGGIDVLSGGTDTTWLYDGTSWTAAGIPGTRPPVRTGAEIVYDSTRDVCVLTGGMDPTNGNPILDTWELDLTAGTWTQIPSAFAGGRRDFGMVYDSNRGVCVLFGGFNNQTFSPFTETWEYGARAETFGSGCAGSNGVPSLDSADAPRIGQTFTLDANNLEATIGLAFFALSVTEIPAVPLAGIGMPGCTGYVAPDLLLSITGSGGAASLPIPMPNSVTLIGSVLFSQALSFDPGVNALSLTSSNGHRGTVGN